MPAPWSYFKDVTPGCPGCTARSYTYGALCLAPSEKETGLCPRHLRERAEMLAAGAP